MEVSPNFGFGGTFFWVLGVKSALGGCWGVLYGSFGFPAKATIQNRTERCGGRFYGGRFFSGGGMGGTEMGKLFGFGTELC